MGQPSPTDHPACSLVRELSKRKLRAKQLQQSSMQPEHVHTLALCLTGQGASLPDLMMLTSIAIMFAGFLRFNDLAQVSVYLFSLQQCKAFGNYTSHFLS